MVKKYIFHVIFSLLVVFVLQAETLKDSLVLKTTADSSYTFNPSKNLNTYNPEFSWKNIEKWYPVSDSIVKYRGLA